MNYVQKNRRDILLISGALILLIGLILWLFQGNQDTGEINASLSKTELVVGEKFTFEDKSIFGNSRLWLFGDGNESTQRKGQHAFYKPDVYNVTLRIDKKYTKTFQVVVTSTPQLTSQPTVEISTVSLIQGPAEAYQLQNVKFDAVSDEAKVFLWRIKETGRVFSREKYAETSFEKAGTYTIVLLTDVDKEPVEKVIKIRATYPTDQQPDLGMPAPLAPAGPSQADINAKINDDFRVHLQQIANGVDTNSFNTHYGYLLRTYLCNKDNTSTSVNGDLDKDFYSYCMDLRMVRGGVIIQDVKTNYDAGMSCVTRVEVKQTK